jgi:hypothetical protein
MALEAAEKALFSNESDKQYAAGAKAQRLFCAICGTTQEAAEKPLIPGNMSENRSSVAKATTDSNGFTRGLKPPSPSELSFSAACEVLQAAVRLFGI